MEPVGMIDNLPSKIRDVLNTTKISYCEVSPEHREIANALVCDMVIMSREKLFNDDVSITMSTEHEHFYDRYCVTITDVETKKDLYKIFYTIIEKSLLEKPAPKYEVRVFDTIDGTSHKFDNLTDVVNFCKTL